MGGLLTVGCFVASSRSSALIWIPLAVLAFLVFWLPAFFGLDSRCPHCNQRFFGDPRMVRGVVTIVITVWTFLRVRSCRRCLIPFRTPQAAAEGAVKLARDVAAQRIAAGWRCACGTVNDKGRSSCSQCWAPRLDR
jgi:hypothetical protein